MSVLMLLRVYVFVMWTETSFMVVVLAYGHVSTGDRVRSHVRPCGSSDVQSSCATGLRKRRFYTVQQVRDILLKLVHI